MTPNPHLTPQRQPEDHDAALRPKTLAEFVGQAAAKDNLTYAVLRSPFDGLVGRRGVARTSAAARRDWRRSRARTRLRACDRVSSATTVTTGPRRSTS